MKHKIKLKKICLICLLVLLFYALLTSLSIYLYGNADETRTADAAIVLGAGIQGNKPSPVFEERIKHGIWLYKNGYVKKLIFTGGKGEGKKYSESFIAKKYAVENGVPEKDVLIEEQSTITRENLEYVTEIVNDNNLSTFLIVSDPLHMKRAMLMAKDCGFHAYSSPTKTTKYESVKSKTRFLARETFFYIGYQVYGIFK